MKQNVRDRKLFGDQALLFCQTQGFDAVSGSGQQKQIVDTHENRDQDQTERHTGDQGTCHDHADEEDQDICGNMADLQQKVPERQTIP